MTVMRARVSVCRDGLYAAWLWQLIAWLMFGVIALATIVFTVVAVLLTLLLFFYNICRHGFEALDRCHKMTLEGEEEIILEAIRASAYPGLTLEHKQFLFQFGQLCWLMHSIVAKPKSDGKPHMLFVHGIGGTSLSFAGIFDRFSDSFTCHFLDLPGFGRSNITHGKRSNALKMSGAEVVDLYCQCLHNYVTVHGLSKVHIVGHSFGAFLCSEFSKRHPELVEKLILVNTGGIFPVLGTRGAYWAKFFAVSIPQVLLRLWGSFGRFLCYNVIIAFQIQRIWFYWVMVLSNQEGYADLLVSRFITFRGPWSAWNAPSAKSLLDLSLPIGFVYGSDDDIMPLHQPQVFSSLCDAPVPVCAVPGAGHSPFADAPEAFCIALRAVMSQACKPGGAAKELSKLLSHSFYEPFKMSYSEAVTHRMVDKLYLAMKSVYKGLEHHNYMIVVDGSIKHITQACPSVGQ